MPLTDFLRRLTAHGTRGFTLIELLVVIAIIGILSSVVLASLNTARNKGADAAIKANLVNSRAEAELWYDNNSNTYTGVCATTGTGAIGDNVKAADVAFDGSAPTYAIGSAATATGGQCHDSANAWAAAVPLKNPSGSNGYYCVDSTGIAKFNTGLAINAVVCP